ncbi:hypothetical protein KFK09_002756 [Dendrobium nobile]|uniref:Uncharacterized protein n=1 Tax=Dendrobium nobile TaxID=94219 RepID=A0A8T3C289_DENNO|nr:hypothetical protein KFK09_002756 [Dendrobium nobile]
MCNYTNLVGWYHVLVFPYLANKEKLFYADTGSSRGELECVISPGTQLVHSRGTQKGVMWHAMIRLQKASGVRTE